MTEPHERQVSTVGRRARIAVAVLAGLLVLFYGGGGWYFADQIRADALAVAEDPMPDGPVPDDAEEITYRCGTADCPAWYVRGDSDTWAILVHGRAASRAEPLHGFAAAVRAGMPALDISYRNDTGAPADPSGVYRYGGTEWEDLAGAVEHARANGAEHAVLFGYSMGGGIVASYLRHVQAGGSVGEAGFVTGVVLDAPMLSLGRTIDFEASQRDLPLVGLPIPSSLVGTAKQFAAWRFDVDWDAVDYLDADWLDVPALVFHGDDDGTVPLSTSKQFAAAGDDVTLVITPGATHVGSWQADSDGYDDKVDEFLDDLP